MKNKQISDCNALHNHMQIEFNQFNQNFDAFRGKRIKQNDQRNTLISSRQMFKKNK